MNLDRIIFHVDGARIKQALDAAKNLPEGVLKGQTILLEVLTPVEKVKKGTFCLRTKGSLYSLELPEGLSNIRIYRINDPNKGNGEVSFDCGEYRYIIPHLED